MDLMCIKNAGLIDNSIEKIRT